MLTLFLPSADLQQRWVKYFEQATGSYNIRDYYSFAKRNPAALPRKKTEAESSGSDEEEQLKMGQDATGPEPGHQATLQRILRSERYQNLFWAGFYTSARQTA